MRNEALMVETITFSQKCYEMMKRSTGKVSLMNKRLTDLISLMSANGVNLLISIELSKNFGSKAMLTDMFSFSLTCACRGH